MSFIFECLGRSYYYVADVVSLFGMMPLLVRLLGLHDMTIVILAVYCQVSLSMTICHYWKHTNICHIYICLQWFLILILWPLPQAAKALIYFFAEDIKTIYAIIFFSVFRWVKDCHGSDLDIERDDWIDTQFLCWIGANWIILFLFPRIITFYSSAAHWSLNHSEAPWQR